MNPKGMDEFFWGNDFEDVVDWIEKSKMATKVKNCNETKFFKDCSLEFVRQIFKMTYKNINLAIAYWPTTYEDYHNTKLWSYRYERYPSEA